MDVLWIWHCLFFLFAFPLFTLFTCVFEGGKKQTLSTRSVGKPVQEITGQSTAEVNSLSNGDLFIVQLDNDVLDCFPWTVILAHFRELSSLELVTD